MKQGIGEILVRLRKESGITQAALREGRCSASELAKIENNQKNPDPFLLDRLFRRLGKSAVRLEYVLSADCLYQSGRSLSGHGNSESDRIFDHP